jgi:hypothetical protein
MEVINLGAGDGLPPVSWAAVVEKLDEGSAPQPDAHNARTKWLTTVNEDGSPHVTAVGAVWLDGAFWFQTGAGTRKSRNVVRDPRCSIALSIRDADVVVEGDAARVTDAVERVSHRAPVSDRGVGSGAGGPDSFQVLMSATSQRRDRRVAVLPAPVARRYRVRSSSIHTKEVVT